MRIHAQSPKRTVTSWLTVGIVIVILTLSIITVVALEVDGWPLAGEQRSVERSAPTFHRPTDRVPPAETRERAPVNRPTDERTHP